MRFAAGLLLAFGALLVPGTAASCERALSCVVRICEFHADAIALAHADEETRSGSNVVLVVDAILRPSPPSGLAVGARLSAVASKLPKYLVFWQGTSPSTSYHHFAVTANGGVDCVDTGGTHLCSGEMGLTVDQVAQLNGTPQCGQAAIEAGYDRCGDASCGGCTVVPPGRRMLLWPAALGVLPLAWLVRRRTRRSARPE